MAWGDQGGNDGKGPWGQNPWGSPPPNKNGGKGPGGSGPQGPDFDELLKKSHEKFKQFFPSDGNDGKKGFALIVGVILVLWLASGVYLVKSDEQGVVMRFGQYHRITAAGLNYHLPYPFESVLTPRVTVINRVEIGARNPAQRGGGDSNIDERLMLTGDENIVDINFEVQWQIGNASEYLFNIRDPEATVKAVSESAMREVIGKTPIAVALAEGKLDVAQKTKILLQKTLDEYKAGISIISVNLLATDPPSQVLDAFRDVQTARADLDTARNQAEAYRSDILPRARGEAQKLVFDAEGYKQEVIARAEGEASRFSAIYNEYKLAKDVTQKRMYLETMEEIMAGMSKIVVDSKGSGVLPYLPLQELKNKPAAKEVVQ